MGSTAKPAAPATDHPVLALLDLSRRARAAASLDELAFLLVNDTRRLVPYRQAALWFAAGGVRTLSGVVQPEGNAPYVQWLNQLFRALTAARGETPVKDGHSPQRVDRAALPADLAAQWEDWLPPQAVWIPIPASDEHPGSAEGGLLLAGDVQAPDDALALLGDWLPAWRHAWLARFRRPAWRHFWQGRHGDARQPRRRWWQRRRTYVLALLLGAMLLPVRMTILAPGELVPADPVVIRAPLDGVIGEFQVRPNDTVKKGQLLFTFDEAPIASRLDVARHVLATAEAEYRQFAQLALNADASKAQLAALIGTISERRAETQFLQRQFERSRVLAPRAGMVLFDAPSEWIGKPVQTGERVMRLADPDKVEIEAWVSVGDAIPIVDHAPVKLYLAASPFVSVAGEVRYVAHDAVPLPDGRYAYRLRAAIDRDAVQRIGLKGTLKVYGRRVPLAYWMLRKPLAVLRQFTAL